MINKFSVIVPTMWRFPPFVKFLADMVKRDEIGEIIIINNDVPRTPPNEPTLIHPKIIIHNFAQNIFVNPAWNYGVHHAKYEKICILNDDVIFDLKIFDRLTNFLTPGKFVAIGLEPPESKAVVTGQIELIKYHPGVNNWQYGSMMFINKSDWLHIPDDLKIYYGDFWIWETMLLRYNEIYLIKDLFFYTPHSTTADFIPNRAKISWDESKIYGNHIAEYKRLNKYQ